MQTFPVKNLQIMNAAQDLVDAWLKATRRKPFHTHAHEASLKMWPSDRGGRAEREAFVAAAEMVRSGRAHAKDNPDPMLYRIDKVLRSD
jgi:hypothetical protein